MNPWFKPVTLVFAAFLLAGCSARRYYAAPLVASETASRLESRNLADIGLQSFMEKQLGHPVSPWPPKTWDLQKLSLAGLYFNPTLESASQSEAERIFRDLVAGEPACPEQES
jgi:hypothetical protein